MLDRHANGFFNGLLVHSDCHRHNVVIANGRGSLIDFGECRLSLLVWDLGVAVADSAIDAPDRASACRRNLLGGYLSLLPQAASIVAKNLPVFEAMRCLEIITWPVSDWTPERIVNDTDQPRENIKVSTRHIEALLGAPFD